MQLRMTTRKHGYGCNITLAGWWEAGCITINRFVDGKNQEDWINWDALGLMQQLGVIPSMG